MPASRRWRWPQRGAELAADKASGAAIRRRGGLDSFGGGPGERLIDAAGYAAAAAGRADDLDALVVHLPPGVPWGPPNRLLVRGGLRAA